MRSDDMKMFEHGLGVTSFVDISGERIILQLPSLYTAVGPRLYSQPENTAETSVQLRHDVAVRIIQALTEAVQFIEEMPEA